MSVDAFPLSWPAGWPRTKSYERSRAKFGKAKPVYRSDGTHAYTSKGELTVSQACDRLMRELDRLGVDIDDAVLSTNVRVRLDGLPMSKQRVPDDPGAAVYFKLNGEPMCLPCDRWDRVADNIAAIAAHVEAMRGMERWGVGSTAQHFAGFKALPPPGGSVGADGPAWWAVLKVSQTAPFEIVKAAYRASAHANHPDRGGDAGAMAVINRAWEQAQAALSDSR
jgi:hypothetical protein